MKQKKGIPMRDMEKPHFDKDRQSTPPRVGARMEGKVKNAGVRPVRKPKKAEK